MFALPPLNIYVYRFAHTASTCTCLPPVTFGSVVFCLPLLTNILKETLMNFQVITTSQTYSLYDVWHSQEEYNPLQFGVRHIYHPNIKPSMVRTPRLPLELGHSSAEL